MEEDTIFKEREELMVSPTGGYPTMRVAHFLNPPVTILSTESPSSVDVNPLFSNQKNGSLRVLFRGWRYPKEKWRIWVENMHCKYQSVWKKNGIYEAIMGSTYKIQRHKELMFGLAEKWNRHTNTFVFPWGEATITLEDMVVLGGFSVLGESVLTQIDDKEFVDIENSLTASLKEGATKAVRIISTKAWLEHFMRRESYKLEHEAFLSFWLSEFVFPADNYLVEPWVFPIASLLSKGTRIALAPALLSNIYKNLTLWKSRLITSTESELEEIALNLYAPFQLVQLWAWERFSGPNPVENQHQHIIVVKERREINEVIKG